MDQHEAEAIELQVEQADELMQRVDEMLDENATPETFDRAINELLPFMKKNPLYAAGWLRIGQLSQAGTDAKPLNTDEAELALRWSCFLNNTWPDSFLSLGDFLLTERAEATAAFDCFRAAADLALEQLEDAYVGLIDSLNALGDTDELKKIVEESSQHFPSSEAIQDAISDWDVEE